MRLGTGTILETNAHPQIKMEFWVTFAGTKGAPNRIKIVKSLMNKPHNVNQLSEELRLDYKTVRHHIKVLEEKNFVSKIESSYNKVFFMSPLLEENLNLIEEIQAKL